jgi:hypothetical protein
VPQKARLAAAAVWAGIPGGATAFDETSEELTGDLTGRGLAYLRLAVRGADEATVGRAFSGAVVETSLASYPGTFFTSAPSGAQAVARYWPTTVGAEHVVPRIRCGGRTVAPTERPSEPAPSSREPDPSPREPDPSPLLPSPLVTVPLGVLVGARSGDKGGNANVGVWADTDAVAGWLLDRCDAAWLQAVLPEVAPFPVTRYELANLRAVNFVVEGILGWGVASSLRLDTQAKGLGELLRSRDVEVPAALVAAGPPAARWATWSDDPR